MTLQDLYDQLSIQGPIQVSSFDDNLKEHVYYLGDAALCDYMGHTQAIECMFSQDGFLHIEIAH